MFNYKKIRRDIYCIINLNIIQKKKYQLQSKQEKQHKLSSHLKKITKFLGAKGKGVRAQEGSAVEAAIPIWYSPSLGKVDQNAQVDIQSL